MTTKQFVVFDDAGTIIRSGWCPDGMVDIQARAGEYVMEGTGADDLHYVSEGSILLRPESSVTLNGTQLDNVHFGSTLVVNGQEFSVTDSTVILEMQDIGKYEVTIKCWPYLDKTFEIVI